MKITIENMVPYKIFYIRHTGPYGSANVETMESLKKWTKLNNLYNDSSIILGITLDNPQTTKPENCRYDACLVDETDFLRDKYCSKENIASENSTISKDDYAENNINKKIDGRDVKERIITGGKYAVFKIEHTATAVQEAWTNIFPTLAENKFAFDSQRPIIERYAVKMVKQHLCEICVPVY